MRIRQGDKVMVISGKDAGKQSRVSRAFPKTEKVIVEGVNIAKRHQRARGQTMQGGIIARDMPIHVSNVMLVCDKDGPVRAGHQVGADGVKRRVCRKCGDEL